jgi:ABC-type uncharacterized transport system permease subunit
MLYAFMPKFLDPLFRFGADETWTAIVAASIAGGIAGMIHGRMKAKFSKEIVAQE